MATSAYWVSVTTNRTQKFIKGTVQTYRQLSIDNLIEKMKLVFLEEGEFEHGGESYFLEFWNFLNITAYQVLVQTFAKRKLTIASSFSSTNLLTKSFIEDILTVVLNQFEIECQELSYEVPILGNISPLALDYREKRTKNKTIRKYFLLTFYRYGMDDFKWMISNKGFRKKLV